MRQLLSGSVFFVFCSMVSSYGSIFAKSSNQKFIDPDLQVLLINLDTSRYISPFYFLRLQPDLREFRNNLHEVLLKRHADMSRHMIVVSNNLTFGSNLNNTQVSLSLPLLLFALNFSQFLPGDLAREFPTYEYYLEKTYLNVVHWFFGWNPFPSLSYILFIKNPAINYFGLRTLEDMTWYYGAGPYADDQLFKRTEVSNRSYGIALTYTLY
ncbi:MAG: hypothetical protein KDK41_12960 [Leptospiraceae bacterium]|nr:hypothetical protein [Leptospiraceae bacterium]MCB1201549.1 hypothetical protein [Leptospiraceae bacterium]